MPSETEREMKYAAPGDDRPADSGTDSGSAMAGGIDTDGVEEQEAEPVFVDSTSGETLPLGDNIPEGGEVSEGDILRLVGEDGTKRHFRIDHIEFDDPPRVTVTEVSSNLKQVLLLLLLLGVGWYAIKFVLHLLR